MFFGLFGGNKKQQKYEKMSTEELKAQASVLRNDVVDPEISSSETGIAVLDSALTGALGGGAGYYFGGKAGDMKIRKPFMPEKANSTVLRTAKNEMNQLISLVHENPAAAEGLLKEASAAGKIKLPSEDIAKVAEQFVKDIKRYHVGSKWGGLALGATVIGVLNYMLDVNAFKAQKRSDSAENLGYAEKVLSQREAAKEATAGASKA